MKILVSGSLAYDRIMEFPGKFNDHILPEKIHMLNVCFVVNGVAEKFGGTAGNIAYNLALLGERPVILAAVGSDFDRYEHWLTRNGLSLEGIRRIEQELTAGGYITSDQGGNQITVFNPGAMKHPCRFRPDGYAPDETLAIVSPGNAEDMLTCSRSYKQGKIPYIFDPGQQIPMLSREQLIEMTTGSRMLIVNNYELQMMENDTGLDKKDFFSMTGVLIVTLGENGSLVCTAQEEIK
ncbi:MAG: PfkB family carbohydrate kinase, partial [Dehalococcoidia bacterium]|nr:PfkB family carbohydrate kinase [Dehalococcoidia bacterium]